MMQQSQENSMVNSIKSRGKVKSKKKKAVLGGIAKLANKRENLFAVELGYFKALPANVTNIFNNFRLCAYELMSINQETKNEKSLKEITLLYLKIYINQTCTKDDVKNRNKAYLHDEFG
ncbi:hypothetical protein HELRODRAFT_180943 [Helobdella robusta]|uniref:Uncharacterized protein n=1 Tax=Helobdella robusta TaxID=6412 RepID=T1FGG2_HELRO|nr:hypothetical protein HELRODRAFT_180943 [Helobdella robusta]ESN93412.1 hypothetical protein HELRODRAFT_180943 [Helobdella robusta]